MNIQDEESDGFDEPVPFVFPIVFETDFDCAAREVTERQERLRQFECRLLKGKRYFEQ